jgi:hypothetical protein
MGCVPGVTLEPALTRTRRLYANDKGTIVE